ncbi:MAG: SDR family oxidoreductase [Halanaerobiales bacterium]|nr:SDR family oxidoreductase [Halanaerobiales bacterium]
MSNKITYHATKVAVDALTITLAAELADKGITVNTINPGLTDTGWIKNNLREKLIKRFPMGRLGQSEDTAKIC